VNRLFLLLVLVQLCSCRVGYKPPCLTDVHCDDGNPCTVDRCRLPQGCVYDINAVPCDDLDDCSSSDRCHNGFCAGGETDRDSDGDGYLDGNCPGGDDCDDGNPAINPGAGESLESGGCDDFVDNDCDGRTDQEDLECLSCTVDADCDDGLFCTGLESCDVLADCVDGIPPCPDTVCNHCTEAQGNCLDEPDTE